MAEWSNWSGSVTSQAQVLAPQSLDALASAVRAAPKVRAVGAGHSFMPLCASQSLIVSLSDLPGDIVISEDGKTARVPAGRSIAKLTKDLFELGYALANQGDVNPQSIAGSMATGTHGTGRDIGSLSTLARSFTCVDAHGELIQCSADNHPDLFQAQRLSLGMFGVAVDIELDIVPAFYLQERLTKMPFAQAREQFEAAEGQHRHVEFFVFPYSDHVIFKTLTLTDPCDAPKSTSDMEEADFKRVLDLGKGAPFMIPSLQKAMMLTNFESRRRGPAFAIYPSDRSTRFEEMEYEVPRAVGFEALSEVIKWVRKKKLPVAFPFEFRVVAGDDIWMSPMNAGPVASISMHQYQGMDWRRPFEACEPILRQFGGRPHWAKRHSLTRTDVDALYPMAPRYRDVRRTFDPTDKFLNDHLSGLFQ